MERLKAIHALAGFARLVSENAAVGQALQHLADTLVELAGCGAAAVLQVSDDRLIVVAARNVPEQLRGWSCAADALDSALGRAMIREAGQGFVQSKTLPLVSSGGLFGAVVLLWQAPDDGSERWHDDLAQGLVDLAATILAMSAHAQKLAKTNQELRQSREALARTEKLRSLGQMAAGVSHDLKNILNPIGLYLQVAQRALAKGNTEGVEEGLRGVKEAVTRGTEVLERLRNFSRQAPHGKNVAVDLNKLAHEATQLAQPRMASAEGRRFRLHEAYGTPPAVQGEPGEIVSAVLNLLVNAADAMTAGGEIRVSTGARDAGAWITVADSGPGMSAEVKARVFEPFFTTKGEQGTGLGLAMVYATVQRHGGTVTLESEPGQGAAFTLWFPEPKTAT